MMRLLVRELLVVLIMLVVLVMLLLLRLLMMLLLLMMRLLMVLRLMVLLLLVRHGRAAAGVALAIARVRTVTVRRTFRRLTVAAASAVALLARPTSHRADL